MNATPLNLGTDRGGQTSSAPLRARDCLRGSAREVLARLADGDPLGVAARIAQHLTQQRLLMDEHRAFLRCLAFIARASQRYAGRPGIDRWLKEQVVRGVSSLRSVGASGEPGARWSELAQTFGLGTEDLDRACARFHALPFEARDAFFSLVLEGQAIEDLVYPGSRSAVEIATDARRALEVFLSLQSQPRAQGVCS